MTAMGRREFLAAAGATAASAAVGAADGGAAKKGSGLKKAIKYYMVQPGKTLLEKMKLCKKLGYDAIELDSPNNFTLAEVLKARDESGLPITGLVDSVHWGKPLSDPDPKVVEAGIKGLKTAIADAKAYGATTVLLVPAVVNPKVRYIDAWKRSQDHIRTVLPFAAEHGIKIAIENVWNKFLVSPLEMAKYLDEFESPWIGSHFDIGNIVEFGFPQDWIRTLGKRILKTDVKEYGARRFNHKLGEGNIDWAAVRQALAEIGYQDTCATEMSGGDEAYLADMSARMDKVLGIRG